MSYKSMILTSLWIFSSGFIAPVFGMETKNNVNSTAGVEKVSKKVKKPRAALQTQQPNNNSVNKGKAVIKSLKISLDNIRGKKPQQPRQQKQNAQPQQQERQSQQQQQKLPQQKNQQKKTQPQQRQQQKQQNTQPQQQQKENIPLQKNQQQSQKLHQQKAPQRQSPQKVERQLQQKLQQSQQKQNNSTVHNNDNAVKVERIEKPVQRQRRNKVQTAQDAAVILATNALLQNERNKKTQQQGGNKKQNVQPVVKKEQKNIVIEEQDVEPKIIHSKNRVCIYDPSQNREIILFKEVKDILSPGTYYRTPNGLRLVPKNLRSNNGLPMVKNHCSRLCYADNTALKMCVTNDVRHSFPIEVEREFSDCARVVIHNSIDNFDQIKDSKKRFDLYVTVPGRINILEHDVDKKIIAQEYSGVFELMVKKNLYQNHGNCYHRFHAPKGMVGAEEFGAKAQNKRIDL